MNWATAIVIIVAIMILGGYLRNRQGSDRNTDRWDADAKSPRELEMEAELEQLRERVKVLERIATDENDTTRLSAEIDKLRDE